MFDGYAINTTTRSTCSQVYSIIDARETTTIWFHVGGEEHGNEAITDGESSPSLSLSLSLSL